MINPETGLEYPLSNRQPYTETKQPPVPDVVKIPCTVTIGGKRKHKTRILTTIRIRCEDKLHRISVCNNGRLFFHDHPPHGEGSLASYDSIVQLGGYGCKCYEIRRQWQKGVGEYSYPVFFRHRPYMGTVNIEQRRAWKLQRELCRRREPEHEEPLQWPSAAEPSTTERIKRTLTMVNEKLHRRGYDSMIMESSSASLSIGVRLGGEVTEHIVHPNHRKDKDKNYAVLFSINATGRGFWNIINCPIKVDDILVEEQENMPIKKLADIIETSVICRKIISTGERNRNRTKQQVADRYKQTVHPSNPHCNITAHEGQSLFGFTISFQNLTQQAMPKIMEELDSIIERARRLEAASGKRALAAERFPPKPANGVY